MNQDNGDRDTRTPAHTAPQLRQMWGWMVQNKAWVWSGVGTALLAAVISYFLSTGSGTQAGRDVNNAPGGIIQTGPGTINQERKGTP